MARVLQIKVVTLLLGTKVVLKMPEAVTVPNSHVFFLNNYFANYNLLVHLRNDGYQATGTIKENTLSKCHLKPTNKMKEK